MIDHVPKTKEEWYKNVTLFDLPEIWQGGTIQVNVDDKTLFCIINIDNDPYPITNLVVKRYDLDPEKLKSLAKKHYAAGA